MCPDRDLPDVRTLSFENTISIGFDMICKANEIEHRQTKPNHPWTNGQMERRNRTIKDATVKRYHYESYNQLRNHLTHFLNAYNFARRSAISRFAQKLEDPFRVFGDIPRTYLRPFFKNFNLCVLLLPVLARV